MNFEYMRVLEVTSHCESAKIEGATITPPMRGFCKPNIAKIETDALNLKYL